MVHGMIVIEKEDINMSIDEMIDNLQKDIVNTINNAQLPLSIVELVLKQVLNEVYVTKMANIQKAKEAEAEAKETDKQ